MNEDEVKKFFAGWLYAELEEGGDKNKLYVILLELATIINTADNPATELKKLDTLK